MFFTMRVWNVSNENMEDFPFENGFAIGITLFVIVDVVQECLQENGNGVNTQQEEHFVPPWLHQ